MNALKEPQNAVVFCKKATRCIDDEAIHVKNGFKGLAAEFGYNELIFPSESSQFCAKEWQDIDIFYDETGFLEGRVKPGEISVVGSVVMYKGPLVSETMERYAVQREAINTMQKMMDIVCESGCGDFDASVLDKVVLEDEMRSLVKVLSFYREYGDSVSYLLEGLSGDFSWKRPFPTYEIQSSFVYDRYDGIVSFPARMADLCKIWHAAIANKNSCGYIPLEGSNLEHIGKVLGINLMVAAYYEKTPVSDILKGIV